MIRLILIALLCLLSVQPGKAGSAPAPEVDSYFHKLKIQSTVALDVSSFPKGKETFIDFVLDNKGFVENPKIQSSCGDQNLDFACLEAVSLLRPATQKQFFTEENRAGIHFRGESVKTSPFSKEKQSRTANHFWIHEIPVVVSVYYPESFNEAELKSSENVLPLAQAINTRKSFERSCGSLKSYVRLWKDFFVKHPTASKEEIRLFAQNVKQDIEK